MNEGEVIQQGNPIDVFRRPENLFAATFVGTKNVLPAVVEESGKWLKIRLDGGSTQLLAESSSDSLCPGQNVWACVDADDIDLIATNGAESRVNAVTVEVTRTILTAGTVTVEGRLDAHTVRIHVGGSRRLDILDRPGETIACAFSRVVVIPRD
jgi:ABC-type Fe3+/spermidine/putrescine transport system ATPase subunit